MDKCEFWLHVVKKVFFVKAFSKEAPLRLNLCGDMFMACHPTSQFKNQNCWLWIRATAAHQKSGLGFIGLIDN